MDYTGLITPALGATGLLAVVVMMVLRGSLIPRSVLDDMRNDKDAQIATWKEAFEKNQAVQEVQRQQISALLDAARTTTHVIQALPEAAGLNSGRGRHELASPPEE